jgi:hypothetical protein
MGEIVVALNLAGYFDLFLWSGLEVPVGVKVFQERNDVSNRGTRNILVVKEKMVIMGPSNRPM